MKIDFEEFLNDKFAYVHPEVLDDEMPDRLDEWVAQLDGFEFIDYADEFAKLKVREFGERLKTTDLIESESFEKTLVIRKGYNLRNRELNTQIDKELSELK